MKLNIETLSKLMAWQAEGCRQVSIKIGDVLDNDNIEIFAYDYDLMHGKHIKDIADLPDTEKMKIEKIKRLERELKECRQS